MSKNIKVEDFPPGTFPAGWTVINSKEASWLNTFYLAFPTDNVLSLVPGEVHCSGLLTFRDIPDVFMVQFALCRDYRLSVSLCRYRQPGQARWSDDGCFLYCHFTVVGFSHDSVVPVALLHDQDAACAFFHISSAIRKLREMNTRRYLFEVKAVVRLVENEELPGAALDRQENALRELRETLSAEVVGNLAALLDRPGLVKVFLGRYNSASAQTKLDILKRSARYSSLLVEFMQAREEGTLVYPEDLPNIINFIVNGDDGDLSEVDALLAYLLSQTTWIPYLMLIMKDFVSSQPEEDINFLVDVLLLANHLEDKEVFDKVSLKFLDRYDEATGCVTYKNTMEQTPYMLRSVIHSVTYMMHTKDTWIPHWRLRTRRRSSRVL